MTREKSFKRTSTVNRNYKDTLFRLLFVEKEALLSLYNAINKTDYTETSKLEIVTLENAIYMNMKNDLAFLIDFQLHMYEHQSTINANMPLRFLQYVSREYEKLIDKHTIYRSRQISLPAPHFVVFYNGTTEQPEQQEMYLSQAYEITEEDPKLELKILILNINLEKNKELMEHCQTLKEYMQYVVSVRKNLETMEIEEAVDWAINECIQKGILAEFLMKHRAEAKAMSIYEYNEEEVIKLIRSDEREMGMAEGIEIGRIAGIEAGRAVGLEIGRATGLEAGRIEIIVSQICKKLTKGKSAIEISDALEADISDIQIICTIAKEYAPEYSVDAICTQYKKIREAKM